MFGVPVLSKPRAFRSSNTPSGTRHAIDAVFDVTATSSPKGGAEHGILRLEVPEASDGPIPRRASARMSTRPSAASVRRSIRATWPRFMMFVNMRPRAWIVRQPAPVAPAERAGERHHRAVEAGRREDALRVHLVLVPELPAVGRRALASACRGLSPDRMSFGRAARGLSGNGCVGHVASPGTSLCGTGRSSTPNSGSPVSRLKMKSRLIFVVWRDGRHPAAVLIDVEEHRRGRQIPVPDVVMHELLEPFQLAGRRIERDQAIAVQVPAPAIGAIEIGRGRPESERRRGRARRRRSCTTTRSCPTDSSSSRLPTSPRRARQSAARCETTTAASRCAHPIRGCRRRGRCSASPRRCCRR